MASSFVIVHGGSWNKDKYEDGLRDYVPIPVGGMRYEDLLSKLESRLNKDLSTHTFDIDALFANDQGQKIRMKVTDDFEWRSLIDLTKYPTIYVIACERIDRGDNVSSIRTLPPIVQSLSGSTSSNHGVSSQWIIPGVSQQVGVVPDELSSLLDPVSREQLICGSIFPSKDSLISAIGTFHLRNFLEFISKRSDKGRLYVVCKFEMCKFCIRSKSYGKEWIIKKMIEHTCERDLRRGCQVKVSSKAISDHCISYMAEDGFVLRPRDIQGQVLREFGINLRYSAALAGRNCALKMKYGDHESSFQMLPMYFYMLEQLNPGSVVDLQTGDDHSFQYCYFSLAACVVAFRSCRPVIVIDATHLKGKYKGVLFVASTKDANEQIVPLAFGIGDKENDSSWTWFLEHIRQTFGVPDNLLIVSDQHISIKNSIEYVFPGTAHGLCSYHIQGNLKSWGKPIIDLFQAAATAYRESDFNAHMLNIALSAPGAHAKLMAIGPIKWAKCRCPVRRYTFGTSNVVEVLNSRLKWGRKLPICSLMEYCRNLVQSWFFMRRSTAKNSGDELSKHALKRLGFVMKKGSSMKVEPISDFKFKVISGTKSNIVDINSRECSCQVFQQDLFPCSHASAAISFVKLTPAAYVHAYYSTQMWHSTYSPEVMLVPDPCDWRVPVDIESRVVGTPKNPKQAGRPRANRMEAGETTKDNRICARCHKTGHYQRTCTELIQMQITNGEEASGSQVGAKRRRKPKKCGICGVVGHTRQRCNDPHRFE